MRRSVLLVALAAGLVLVCASAGGGARVGERWVITDLGTLGGQRSVPIAINDRGQIIGRSETGKNDQNGQPVWAPFLWQNGKLERIGPLNRFTEVAAINDVGQIIGSRQDDNGAYHGWLWQNGKLTGIGAFRPVAINDRGQIVGVIGDRRHALLWQKGRRTDLGRPAASGVCYSSGPRFWINSAAVIAGNYEDCDKGDSAGGFVWRNGKTVRLGAMVDAAALNNLGQVAGSLAIFKPPSALTHAIIWQAGHLTDLGTFGSEQSAAVDLNDRGQVAVERWKGTWGATVRGQALLWRGGQTTAIGALSGWPYSAPVAITNRGQVIGYSYPAADSSGHWPAGDKRAFVWQDGRMTDLGRLDSVYRFTEPVAANERNQIVGIASKKPGTIYPELGFGFDTYHTVLWTLR